MGLIVKKDEFRDDEDLDVEIIERTDVPDDLPSSPVELIGRSHDPIAEEAAATEAALEEEARLNRETMKRIHGKHARQNDDGEDADAVEGADEPGGTDDGDEEAPRDLSAEVPDDEEEPMGKQVETDGGNGGSGNGGVRLPIVIAAVLIAAVVFAIGGYFVGNGGFGGAMGGTVSENLTEDQLGQAVGSYTYNGAKHDITAREAIEAQYSLDAVKNDDDTYPAPSADTVLAYARNQILLAEAESRGISVSEDEMADYAEQMLQTSDYESIAEQYQVTVDQAKQIVRENALVQKLYEQIVPDVPEVPEAPEEPEEGAEDEPTKAYADYIIKLAGDEWDAEAGTWASEGGPYQQALAGEDFSADGATYEQAQMAYYVAYQDYSTAASEGQQAWLDFANGLYANASVSIRGLFA